MEIEVRITAPMPTAPIASGRPNWPTTPVSTSPISGTVLEVNNKLADAPETVNSDPYGDGWLVKMSVADASEIDGLMTAEAYGELIGA